MNQETTIKSILVVCTGNICRSPTAHGLLRDMLQARGLSVRVDSAGTHNYHVGEQANAQTRAVAKARGVPLDALRARHFERDDFARFDLILLADQSHRNTLLKQYPDEHFEHVHQLLAYAGISDPVDVPDPYYRGEEAFVAVFDLLHDACSRIVDRLSAGA